MNSNEPDAAPPPGPVEPDRPGALPARSDLGGEPGADARPASEDDASRPAERQPADGPGPPRGLGPPWLRGVLGYLGVMIVSGVFQFLLLLALSLQPGSMSTTAKVLVVAGAAIPSSAVLMVAWRRLDRAPLASLGYAPGMRRVAAGLGGGAAFATAVMCLIALGGIAAGGYRLSLDAGSTALALLGWIPVLLVAAHFEELTLRGYLLQELGRRRPLLAVAATSLLFGLLHLANPGALAHPASALLTMVNITLSGVWLATAFLRSGDLWWPTGLHFGWNWAQGALLGLPVSGFRLEGPVRGEIVDPGLLVGTRFGPESSLIGGLVLLALSVEGIAAVVRTGRRVPVVEQHSAPAVSPEGA